MNEVRVYDGEGKLKEIIQPVFDYEGKRPGKTTNKPCKLCGKFTKLMGNQKFCTEACAAKHKSQKAKLRREAFNREREARPIIYCEQCGEPAAPNRRKYCGKSCDSKARKIIAMAKHARTAEIIRTVKKEKNIKLVCDKGNII